MNTVGTILFFAGLIIIIVSFVSIDTTYASFSKQKFVLIVVGIIIGTLVLFLGIGIASSKNKNPKE